MDSSGMEVMCNNSTYGCTFASSSTQDMVNHFQSACLFHPLQCFKCSKMVSKMNFPKHYEQCSKDSSASPCPPPEEALDAAESKASATLCEEVYFLRECVTECTVCVKNLNIAMKDMTADVAEVKVMKEKQQDLEAIVKGQGDVIQELTTSITKVVDKVNNVQEDISGLVNRLDKDAGVIMERVENVDGLVKECAEETKSGAESLSRVLKDVAEEVADVKVVKEKQQDVEARVKLQGNWIEKVGKIILMNAEKVNKVEQGIGTIVERVEKVDGLVNEVRALTHRRVDQSMIHWYIENVSQHIERAKTKIGGSYVKSDVFVVRGYSARLWFQLKNGKTGPCIGLFFFLCRGPNDSTLQWPFRIPYTLSLIHPKDASKTEEHKGTHPGAFPDSFEKPKNEEGIMHGTPHLCTVEAAQKEGFIENDAVCVSVTLHE